MEPKMEQPKKQYTPEEQAERDWTYADVRYLKQMERVNGVKFKDIDHEAWFHKLGSSIHCLESMAHMAAQPDEILHAWMVKRPTKEAVWAAFEEIIYDREKLSKYYSSPSELSDAVKKLY